LRLLEFYASELQTAQQELRPGTTLWLTPTNRSRAAIRRQLLTSNSPILIQPQVLTFANFAEQILRSAPREISPLTDAMRRTLLRRVISGLREQKKLPYFGGIARTSGFLDIVSSLISELKRDEAWPEDFERVTRAVTGEARPRDRELALIYRTYQELLLAKNVYDGEGRFWSARQALDEGHWGTFDKLSLVVVDGFTDFTHTQYEILSRLALRADRCMVSLPLEEPVRRPDLFAKSQAVFDELERTATLLVSFMSPTQANSAVKESKTSSPPVAPALAHLAEWLFANPRETPTASSATGLEVLAVAGQKGEVQLVATRIKELLHEKVPADDIVLAFRGLADYADLIDEVFTAAGIPYASEAGTPLGRAPLLKFLIGVLQLEAEDWPFARLLAILDSSYFRPAWRELAHGRAVRAVPPLLRHYQLDGNRRQILEILQRELQHYEADDPVQSGTRQTADQLHLGVKLLKKLSAATDRLRQEHDFHGWAGVLASLAKDLGAPTSVVATGIETDDDSIAWETFERVLFDAARAEKLPDETPPKLSLTDFLNELTDLLQRQSLGSGSEEAGHIRILEAPQVRNLDVPYLFLAGLTERSFPQHRGDDCLFHEIERRELNRRAAEMGERLELGHRTSRAHEEMLLFYGVVTRARKKLILSYPAVNASGEPLSPSPYLKAIEDLFEPDTILRTVDDELNPIPKADRVLSDADLRVRGLHEALQRQPNLMRLWFDDPSRQQVGRNILAATDLAAERFHTSGFTPAEGLLRNAENRNQIRKRYSREHEFSASQLEAYAACPFKFFLSQVLNIQPLASPESGTDHAQRGSLVHDVLAELYQRLFVHPVTDPTTGELSGEQLATQFQTLVADRIGRQLERTELQRALLRVEQRLLAECGPPFASHHDQYRTGFAEGLAEPLTPKRLEASFGTPHPNAPPEESAQRFPPLIFGSGDDEVRVTGRIDRLDVGRLEDGQVVFNVVDYKTGKKESHKPEEVAAGRELQLALYTLAVQKLEIVGTGAIPWQFGYWKVRGDGFAPAIKGGRRKKDSGIERLDEAVWESLTETLHDIIPRLAAGIRRGDFPVASEDPDCAGYCPYGTVCRINQIRPVADKLNKHWNR
jgi:ATP-dependent helicase/DNAse subunit B